MIVFTVAGQLGQIGGDNDDVMRLVQIRDVLAGQNWYDHHQYRMGPSAAGTLMHWSRLIDLPVIMLILFFDLFLPYEWAEAAAISIWPVATGFGLILAVRFLSQDNDRFIVAEGDLQRAIWGFGILIMGLFLLTYYRFHPGSLDHHNIQLVALGLSFAALCDPNVRPKRFALAGAMTGLSLVIGTEALPFLAVNCGFAALLWAYKGAVVSRAVGAFGVCFAVVLLMGFLIDTPPAAYGQIYCDILAVNYLVLGSLGGLGLFALTRIQGLDGNVKRWAGLAVLGGLCALVLILMSPQCLSNPLGELPENAQSLWLDHVTEAQPLISKETIISGSILYYIGLIFTAWIVTLQCGLRLGFTPSRLYGLALSSAIIIMTLYQLRYSAFGFVIGTLLLIPWAAECYVGGKAKSKDSIAYIFAVALSASSLWHLPSLLIGDDDVNPKTGISTHQAGLEISPNSSPQSGAEKDELEDVCLPDELFDFLNALPPVHILAEPNITSSFLYHTQHRAVNGNYHRNGDGIDKATEMFKQPPARAANMMRAQNIELLYYCKPRGAYHIYAKAAPQGLAAALLEGKDMNGFTKIPLELQPASEAELSLWRLAD